jgi:AcrR family transcriptional regulator
MSTPSTTAADATATTADATPTSVPTDAATPVPTAPSESPELASPPRQRRTRQEMRAETRARILAAAAEVVVERGLDGASIDEITDRAGYTRGAFYSNFSSKEELFVELCTQRLDAYAREVVPLIQAAPANLRASEAVRLLDERRPDDQILLLVELTRLRDSSPDAAALVDQFLERFTQVVEDTIATTVADYGDPDPATVRSAARGLVAALLGLALFRHLGQTDEHAAHLLLSGVGLAAFGEVARQALPDDAQRGATDPTASASPATADPDGASA